jgi:hypothetical protein
VGEFEFEPGMKGKIILNLKSASADMKWKNIMEEYCGRLLWKNHRSNLPLLCSCQFFSKLRQNIGGQCIGDNITG